MINSKKIIENAENLLKMEKFTSLKNSNAKDLHWAIAKACIAEIHCNWKKSEDEHNKNKAAFYLSAEFLMGRAIYNNLFSMGVLYEVKDLLANEGIDINLFEEIDDDALGNGGLGRLAACFLDSAATHDIPLNGYGIRYKYGLFKQTFENGFQKEIPDDWQQFCDPWSIRRDDEKVVVEFANQKVYAVPYDVPIIGYETENINTLRLWQSESINKFDLETFNECKYNKAVKERDDAEVISMILYPNDDNINGKKLRVKQEYFFASASIKDLIRKFKNLQGNDFSKFADFNAIQLNDTHPTIAIPELIRILVDEESIEFNDAFSIAQKSFSYTNHTIMAEALEKWDIRIYKNLLPKIYRIILMINDRVNSDLVANNASPEEMKSCKVIDSKLVKMANLAIGASNSVNGVAKIHTQILKDTVIKDWYRIYPQHFQNKTNGITQRRWLGLCNKPLTEELTKLGCGDFIKNLDNIKKLNDYKDDATVLDRLYEIKQENKQNLADYIYKKEGIVLKTDFIFDIQVKRLHEYKRQLLNAFSILDIYFALKKGKIKDFQKTAFIFGAKAAPSYKRAKGIIKYINEIAKLINNDKDVNDRMQVIFVTDYNVSYAEKLIPAANVSEQISTAGTEASGTGNMKFMLNGAVTLGTYDGANIEIVEQAGLENNYIFGAKVEELNEIKATYNPLELCKKNKRFKRVLETLIDGTFNDGGDNSFKELYDSITIGASWHNPDNYFLLYDFDDYVATKLRLNSDYKNKREFSKKCLLNIANSAIFSSDRTILEYAKDIWYI